MFIGIPLSLVTLSLIGIAFIVLRKFSYLRSAASSISEAASERGIFQNFFPEFFLFLQKLNIRKAIQTILGELEKILRKMRLALLATERLSDGLINRIRRVQKIQMTQPEKPESAPQEPDVSNIIIPKTQPVPTPEVKPTVTVISEIETEEARLIAAITQNPKEANLYCSLGEIYLKAENWPDAKESFQAAMRLRPSDRELAQKLSLVLEKLLQK